jgi:hypothetical protein
MSMIVLQRLENALISVHYRLPIWLNDQQRYLYGPLSH